jgi:hypothetical protein
MLGLTGFGPGVLGLVQIGGDDLSDFLGHSAFRLVIAISNSFGV